MFVEFVGLPGCGKTTISRAVLKPLKKAGFKFVTINDAAELAASKDIEQKRFLKRFEPRVWLYGAVCFARDSPVVYDALFEKARHDVRQNMWLMNFFAHIYYANKSDVSDKFIFLDEGFVHRGATAFFKDHTQEGFKRYLNGVPHSDLIISIETPVETAIERCRNRKSGIPDIYKGSNDAEVTEKFAHLGELHRLAVTHQADAGVPVVAIDGTASVEACCNAVCEAFKGL